MEQRLEQFPDPTVEENEEELLRRAMSDVRPLAARPLAPRRRGRRQPPASPPEIQPLEDFLQSREAFEVVFHPGYQEGGPEVRNRPLMRKLRRGEFSVQAQLDLHGLSQAEAQTALEAFLVRCRLDDLRCVRIIHGKGRNSGTGEGILKQKVPQWLSTRRFSRLILAFSSAPPGDGGTGATYVLLRRPSPES
jgi:DNA-nicking Smr family endonuclease